MTDPKRPVESFARLYDDILDNAKVVLIQPADFGLHCALMVYSHGRDTDGRVPVARARGLLAFSDKGFAQSLARLVAVALVERDGEWLTVHDYLEHNASHAQRIAKRNAASHAARIKWRNAKGSADSMPKEKDEGKGSLDPLETKHAYGTVPRGTNGMTKLNLDAERERLRSRMPHV